MALVVTVGGCKIPVLLYADDVLLLSETEENMQSMLDFVHGWCLS